MEEIEELAFKDRKELANLNELDLLEIIEFLQLDRKQWINQYSNAHNDYIYLQQENQELKKQYCERTDCSGRLGNSKKVDQLEKELEQLKEIEKEHQKINGCLHLEIKELKEKYMKLEDKYIHNVACCNEEDCDLFCEHKELKDRIDKAVEYIEKHTENIDRGKYYEDYVETYYLLKILKGELK